MAFFFYDRTTQFSESDAAGIIHFSKIACYVEEAEHHFLAKAGFPVNLQDLSSCRWPRVNYKCSFSHPILPFQSIRITLAPIYVGKSSINWSWLIVDKVSGSGLCKGEMKTVCCKQEGERLEVCPLPEDLRKQLFTPER